MVAGFSTIKTWDENLAWLTQKTEDPKRNKGENLIPPPQVYTPFLAKYFVPPPPNDSIFGRSYPLPTPSLPPLIRGKFQLYKLYKTLDY